MIRMLGGGVRTCDGITRREALAAGFVGLLGGGALSEAQAFAPRSGRTRSVILINLLGGPAHLDMFDPKPDAPSEIRGEFQTIPTTIDGLRICEHLPRTAKTMHRSTLIRTLTHTFNSHDPYPIITGSTVGNPSAQYSPDDAPSVGAVCQFLGKGAPGVPLHACLPCFPGWGQTWRRKGIYGGYLGSQYDPLISVCSPEYERTPTRTSYDAVQIYGRPQLEGVQAIPELTLDRLNRRRSLVEQVDAQVLRANRSRMMEQASSIQQKSFDLLTSGKVREAFDLDREPQQVRERYGSTLAAQCMLTARRLVEAGVTFVTATYEVFQTGKFLNGIAFDTHENNFDALRRVLLPSLDQGYTALIEDLSSRGMLNDTLVIVAGEMGRSPRVNARAGRDHWPQCGSILVTGGGVKEGYVHGTSDRIGAYPDTDPVTPGDWISTVYTLLGLDPSTTVPDAFNRPMPISQGGAPVTAILKSPSSASRTA